MCIFQREVSGLRDNTGISLSPKRYLFVEKVCLKHPDLVMIALYILGYNVCTLINLNIGFSDFPVIHLHHKCFICEDNLQTVN